MMKDSGPRELLGGIINHQDGRWVGAEADLIEKLSGRLAPRRRAGDRDCPSRLARLAARRLDDLAFLKLASIRLMLRKLCNA
jgi:hypothetical protein